LDKACGLYSPPHKTGELINFRARASYTSGLLPSVGGFSQRERGRRLHMARCVGVFALVLAVLLLTPSVTSAQAIGGTVTDPSGSVLPGVTVEVKSPALIEQVRTAFTNGAGQYQIIELRPGTYSVTFTLPGFGTLVREGIELTTGFTASVDVQLRVGVIAETVTVTGASPLVDVQNVTQQRVATREIIDTMPVAKSF